MIVVGHHIDDVQVLGHLWNVVGRVGKVLARGDGRRQEVALWEEGLFQLLQKEDKVALVFGLATP